MLESALPCPNDATIERLVSGGLAAEERDALLGHAADCDACCALLAALAPASVGAPPSTDAAPGATKGIAIDRYRVLETLGSGGMGTVYCAYDSQLDRKVALKVLREGSVASGVNPSRGSDEAARLLREARAMAKLSHPNVVRVFDVGVSDGRVFVAMELAEGGTVRAWLAGAERSWREVLALFVEAGQGLAAAHKAGLIHRDFKPENLLLRDGSVLVTDFGLARTLEGAGAPSSAHPGPRLLAYDATHVAGTPVYMSPEQLRGDPLDPRADIFSFSVALWEALYGARPFSADAPGGLLQAIASGPPAPKRDGGVPAHVRAALVQGMRFAKEERQATVAELLAACAPRPERTGAIRRAMPWALAAAALGVAAFVAASRIGVADGGVSASPSKVSVPSASPALSAPSPVDEPNAAPEVPLVSSSASSASPHPPSGAPAAKPAVATSSAALVPAASVAPVASARPAPGAVRVRSASLTLEPFGDAATPLLETFRAATYPCASSACLGEKGGERGGSASCRAHVDAAGHIDAATCRDFVGDKEVSCHPFDRCYAAALRALVLPKPQRGAGDVTASFTFVER